MATQCLDQSDIVDSVVEPVAGLKTCSSGYLK